MTDAISVVYHPEISTQPRLLRTPSMVLADSTNVTGRQLIDQFSRLSTRQREALYAMQHRHRLEMRSRGQWCAEGHRDFAAPIVVCLVKAHLAKIVIGKVNSRLMKYAAMTPLGHRMMKAVAALDAVFFQNVAEIGAGS